MASKMRQHETMGAQPVPSARQFEICREGTEWLVIIWAGEVAEGVEAFTSEDLARQAGQRMSAQVLTWTTWWSPW